MTPDKKLNWTKNSFRLFNCPLVILGTVPTNPLPSKYKSRNKDGLEKSGGMDPDKVLLERYSKRRAAASKMVIGMDPENKLFDASM